MDKNHAIDMEKKIRIADLYPTLLKHPNLMKYFDIKSDKLLDEKIEVLEQLASGKKIADIPGFYEIFELLPKEGIWD